MLIIIIFNIFIIFIIIINIVDVVDVVDIIIKIITSGVLLMEFNTDLLCSMEAAQRPCDLLNQKGS